MPEQNLPLSNEVIHKELDLIQDVIKRMADNSFKVKAWMIGILGGIVALGNDALFVTVAEDNLLTTLAFNAFLFLPVICFWYLDAFFLRIEKLYREVYKWVVDNRSNTRDYLYDLNTFTRTNGKNEQTDFLKDLDSTAKVMRSKTLWPFYLFPFLAIFIIIATNIYNHCFN